MSTACFVSTDAGFILRDTPNIVPGTMLEGIVRMLEGIVGWYLP
jgi:hypothetical protein